MCSIYSAVLRTPCHYMVFLNSYHGTCTTGTSTVLRASSLVLGTRPGYMYTVPRYILNIYLVPRAIIIMWSAVHTLRRGLAGRTPRRQASANSPTMLSSVIGLAFASLPQAPQAPPQWKADAVLTLLIQGRVEQVSSIEYIDATNSRVRTDMVSPRRQTTVTLFDKKKQMLVEHGRCVAFCPTSSR